jgi:cytochrome c551/c552
MDVLTDQYFDRIYEDLSREHIKLLQNLRNGTNDEKDTHKQITMLSNLQISVLKLRNFRKALADKRD